MLNVEVRAEVEKELQEADSDAGDVFGLDGSFSARFVTDCGFDEGSRGLLRALRSGTGGGRDIGSGLFVGVTREKLLADSGVAGGEGGRSGARAPAESGTLAYRSWAGWIGCTEAIPL